MKTAIPKLAMDPRRGKTVAPGNTLGPPGRDTSPSILAAACDIDDPAHEPDGMLKRVGGDEREFRPHGINAPFAKKGEAFRKTLTSSFCVAIAAAEPAASSSSRHVFNGVGVIASAAATLLCVAPASDNRATDCSLSSAEKRRRGCLLISPLQGGIVSTTLVWLQGATSV
ncbi:MAG: hypothetical protein ACR2RF_16200 [Geminicoccaceae bacterium]